jgi:hypothetical protein
LETFSCIHRSRGSAVSHLSIARKVPLTISAEAGFVNEFAWFGAAYRALDVAPTAWWISRPLRFGGRSGRRTAPRGMRILHTPERNTSALDE